MKCVLLFALLLLLRLLPCDKTQSSVPAPTEDPLLLLNRTNGSTCAQWLYGKEPPRVKAFQCAGQPAGGEVKFCCGTCAQTRNCSSEEVAEGSPARPTDGGPESCPPLPPVLHGVRLTWFFTGVLFTAIFYWLTWGKGKKYCRRQTFPGHRGVELVVPSSLRSRKHRGSSSTSTRSAPPSSAGAEGLPGPSGCPAAAVPRSAQSVQPQAKGIRKGRRIWYPREPASLRIDPSPSQPSGGGKRFRAGQEK